MRWPALGIGSTSTHDDRSSGFSPAVPTAAAAAAAVIMI